MRGNSARLRNRQAGTNRTQWPLELCIYKHPLAKTKNMLQDSKSLFECLLVNINISKKKSVISAAQESAQPEWS